MQVTSTTGQSATLAGWLDKDVDGVFESGERVTLSIPSGGTTTRVLTFTGLPNSLPTTYLRFRLSTDTNFTGNPQPIGSALNGEVEDYGLTIAPTAATASISGRIRDVHGKSAVRVIVTLTNILTGETITTQTNSSGRYLFIDVPVAQTYLLSVNSRRHTFDSHEQVFALLEDLVDADFTAQPKDGRFQSNL